MTQKFINVDFLIYNEMANDSLSPMVISDQLSTTAYHRRLAGSANIIFRSQNPLEVATRSEKANAAQANQGIVNRVLCGNHRGVAPIARKFEKQKEE